MRRMDCRYRPADEMPPTSTSSNNYSTSAVRHNPDFVRTMTDAPKHTLTFTLQANDRFVLRILCSMFYSYLVQPARGGRYFPTSR
jgi:hypothetical protein